MEELRSSQAESKLNRQPSPSAHYAIHKLFRNTAQPPRLRSENGC